MFYPATRLQIEKYSAKAQQSRDCHHGVEAVSTLSKIPFVGHYFAAYTDLLWSHRNDVKLSRTQMFFRFFVLDLKYGVVLLDIYANSGPFLAPFWSLHGKHFFSWLVRMTTICTFGVSTWIWSVFLILLRTAKSELGITLSVQIPFWAIGIFFMIVDYYNWPKWFRKYKLQPGTNEPVDLNKLLEVFC